MAISFISLTRHELQLLKQLIGAGERGRTISASTSPAGMARLVKARYVTEQAASVNTTLYLITDVGRRALLNAPTNDGLNQR